MGELDQESPRAGAGPLPEGPAEFSGGPGKGTLSESPEGGAALADAKSPGKAGAGDGAPKDDGSPLSVERIAAIPDEEPVPGGTAGLDRNPAAGRAELADLGKSLPQQGGAEELAGKNVGGGGGGGGGAPVSAAGEAAGAAVNAQVQEAQNETKEAMAQSQAEADAYKTQMKEQRDQFEDQQHATMLEQIKTTSPADKRATLKELGYSDKDIAKMKDAEVDAIIQGKLEAEQRKTKIMGMDPDELKALSPAQKIQYLVDLGIDKADLDKIGQQRAVQAFDDIMKVAHVPGQHKVTIKIKSGFLGLTGKSWDVNIKCDDQGNTDIQAQAKGGFLSKLWGWIKAALPIILVVLAPLTMGATLIALSVWQAIEAIKTGDWLGAIIAVAGSMVGVSAFMAAKGLMGAASTFGKIADVAKKAGDVAKAAKAGLDAAKMKNAGSLLGALAGGASAFASFAEKSANAFYNTMTRWSDKLKKWSAIVSGGETVVKGIKSGDPLTAIGGAFDTAAASVAYKNPNGNTTTKNLGRASAITGFVSAGKEALKTNPPDYGAIADAGLGIASTLKEDSTKLGSAQKITAAANKLKTAWQNRASDPGAVADAAVELAGAIQTAKYGEDGDAKGGDASDQSPTKKFERATRVIHAAASALTAATAKPRPNYSAAAEAMLELTAALTDSKKADRAAVLTARFNAWTAAVNSGNEKAILAAGRAFGESIDGMRKEIVAARDAAKKEADKEGTQLPDDPIDLPPGPAVTDGLPDGLPGEQVTLTAPNPGADAGDGDAGDGVLPSRPLPRIDLKPNPKAPKPGAPKPGEGGEGGSEKGSEGNESEGSEAAGEGGEKGEGEKEKDKEKEKEEEKENPVIEGVMQVIEVFAEMREKYGMGRLKAAVDVWNDIKTTYLAFKGDKGAAKYRQAYESLQLLGDGRQFLKEAVEGLKEFQEAFNDPFKTSRILAVLPKYKGYINGLGRIARLGSIPGNLMSATDNLLVVLGFDRSLSGAPAKTTDRLEAAKSLLDDLNGVPEDIEWMIRIGRVVLEKLASTAAATAAKQILRVGAAKLGSAMETAVMEYFAPALDTIAANAPGATEGIAREMVEKIGVWSATTLAKVGGAAAFKGACVTLAETLGGVIKVVSGPEGQILMTVAQLEVAFAEKLYAAGYQGISHFMSARLFGKSIDQVKNEIRAKPIGNKAQADAFFRWAFGQQSSGFLSGGDYEVRGKWWPYTIQHFAPRVGGMSFPSKFATSPIEALQELDPDDIKILIAAPALKDTAIEYVDAEYKRVFKEDP